MRGIIIAGLIGLLIPFVLGGCGSDQDGGGPSYKEMKTMVVDILKTEDAQKAIEEAAKKQQQKLNDNQLMQMLSTPEGQQIQLAVREVLTDPQYPQVLKALMTDPKFAGEFAKAVQKEDKRLHKELMKDPEYQTLMLDFMKNPEFEKLITDIMKGKAFRQQMMDVMKDALNNPLFRQELVDLMSKALEEQTQPKKQDDSGGGESGGDSGSDS